jgi:hypothetical protein
VWWRSAPRRTLSDAEPSVVPGVFLAHESSSRWLDDPDWHAPWADNEVGRHWRCPMTTVGPIDRSPLRYMSVLPLLAYALGQILKRKKRKKFWCVGKSVERAAQSLGSTAKYTAPHTDRVLGRHGALHRRSPQMRPPLEQLQDRDPAGVKCFLSTNKPV